MNAPLIWIVFPIFYSIVLYNLRRWKMAMTIAGIIGAGLLAWLASQLPIGNPISFGPWPGLGALEIGETLNILGRRLTLTDSARPILMLIYLMVAFWFGGSLVARPERLFVPLGLGVAALLTASLAVDPFLYAALLLELAALLCIPILSPPGRPVGRGVLRFLTFQTLGMPFILFTSWLLSEVEANPASPALAIRAAIVIGLGFTFLAAIFPFHSWLPMLGEEAHPYSAAFVFFILPSGISLFMLGFLERFAWLHNQANVFLALRLIGILMVVIGGMWAAFQRHLGRMLGYAAVVEIGLSLLALGVSRTTELPIQDGAAWHNEALLGIFFAQILPRGLALALWAVALSTIQSSTGSLRFRAVQGIAHRIPLAAASVVLAHFSLAGFPLLAGFPVRMALWFALANQSMPFALLALVGNAGLFIAGLRTLAVLVMNPVTPLPESRWQVTENRLERLIFGLGWLQLFLFGLMPQWFLPALTDIARTFRFPTP